MENVSMFGLKNVTWKFKLFLIYIELIVSKCGPCHSTTAHTKKWEII